jgi:hypothetical protein
MIAAVLGIANPAFVYVEFLPPRSYLAWARRRVAR